MKHYPYKTLPQLPKLKLAVIGHVEWMTFLSVDTLPKEGYISHAKDYLEAPAGGGAVTAIQMAKLTGSKVHLITSLGKDYFGEKCFEILTDYGLDLSVAWRQKPTRKGISMVDKMRERSITVIGERLQPTSADNLPWGDLSDYDGVFITAADPLAIQYARKAKIVTATPRVGQSILKQSKIRLDALIGSSLDPDEQIDLNSLHPKPTIYIATEGSSGGSVNTHGRYKPCKPSSPSLDSYGCGDSFAGGLTSALAAGWQIDKAVSLGAYCGAECSTLFGPY